MGSGLFKTDKSWITVNFDFSFIAFQCRYLFILCISVLQMTYVNPKTLLIKNFNIFKTVACLPFYAGQVCIHLKGPRRKEVLEQNTLNLICLHSRNSYIYYLHIICDF